MYSPRNEIIPTRTYIWDDATRAEGKRNKRQAVIAPDILSGYIQAYLSEQDPSILYGDPTPSPFTHPPMYICRLVSCGEKNMCAKED